MADSTCWQCNSILTDEAQKAGKCSSCGAILSYTAPSASHFPFAAPIHSSSVDDPNATEVIEPPSTDETTVLASAGVIEESKSSDIETPTQMPRVYTPASIQQTSRAQTNRPDIHPTEQLVTNINRSRDSITSLASRLQGIALKVAIGSGLIIMGGWLYLSRPLAVASPPPSNVATMITESQSAVSVYIASIQKLDIDRIQMISTLSQAMTGQSAANAGLADSAQDLLRNFLALKPPDPCTNLSNSYFQLLQDQTAMVNKASASLRTNDLKGAASIHDTAMPQLTSEAQSADQALQQLCNTQQTTKPFNIVAEPMPAPSATPSPTETSPTPSPSAEVSPSPAPYATPGPTATPYATTPGGAPALPQQPNGSSNQLAPL